MSFSRHSPCYGTSPSIRALTVECYLSALHVCGRLLIQIALHASAIRIRPCLAYVLDLRAKFVPKETAIAFYDVWRSKALELEKKLQEVEKKHEAEHIGEFCPPNPLQLNVHDV